MEGLAWDDAIDGARPGVLVAHTIRGRTPFEEGKARDLRRKAHETVKRVTDDIEARFHFNTAISATMELLNELSGFHIPNRDI